MQKCEKDHYHLSYRSLLSKKENIIPSFDYLPTTLQKSNKIRSPKNKLNLFQLQENLKKQNITDITNANSLISPRAVKTLNIFGEDKSDSNINKVQKFKTFSYEKYMTAAPNDKENQLAIKILKKPEGRIKPVYSLQLNQFGINDEPFKIRNKGRFVFSKQHHESVSLLTTSELVDETQILEESPKINSKIKKSCINEIPSLEIFKSTNYSRRTTQRSLNLEYERDCELPFGMVNTKPISNDYNNNSRKPIHELLQSKKNIQFEKDDTLCMTENDMYFFE